MSRERAQAAYYQQAAVGQPYPIGYTERAFSPALPPGHFDDYEDDDYAGFVEDYAQDDDFKRNLQFGLIDNGLLVAMTLAGVSLDDRIAEVVGVKGYGALLGASIGNAVSDGVAAIPQGAKAAAGVTLGCLLPVLPIVGALLLGKEIKGTTRNVLLASSAAFLAFAFVGKAVRPAMPVEPAGAADPSNGE